MAATVHGNVNFGLVAETGFYVAAVDYDITLDEKWVPNHEAEEVAGALYNAKAAFTMSGVKRTDETISAVLGASITIANAVDFTDYIDGYTTGGLSFLSSIKPSLKNDDFESLDLAGTFKPWIVPAV